MTPVVREFGGSRDLLPLVAAQPARYPGLLESVVRGTPRARYDIAFAFPEVAVRLVAPGDVRDSNGRHVGTRFFDALDRLWQRERLAQEAASGLPFRDGWLICLGYELAAEIAPTLRLPAPRETTLPIALALRCQAAVVVDHHCDRTLLVGEAGRAELLDVLEADLEVAAASIRADISATAIDEDAAEKFPDGVARVQEHLHAGDVFQINLSREWRARGESAGAATLTPRCAVRIQHHSRACCRWMIGRSRARRQSA